MKKFMVVERFRDGCFDRVYARLDARGRMLPEGLMYLNSWVNKDRNICFQLMETNDESLFAKWMREWDDLVDFEIYPLD